MKSELDTIYPCYGRYRRSASECSTCQVKNYCTEAWTAEDHKRCGRRTSLEVAQALETYAEVPAVYETPSGKTGAAWQALVRLTVFLVSLHPTTLAVLKAKIQNPDWQKREAARLLGIKAVSVKNKISERRPVAAMFYQPKKGVSAMPGIEITADSHVYLSGHISGKPEDNCEVFHDADQRIGERFGCNVVNAAYVAQLIGYDRKQEHYNEVSRALVRTSDFVVMMPGWETCEEARQDHAEALAEGIRIYELAEVLK